MPTGSNEYKGHFTECLTKKETTLRGYYIGIGGIIYYIFHIHTVFLIVSVACAVFTWTVSRGFPLF